VLAKRGVLLFLYKMVLEVLRKIEEEM